MRSGLEEEVARTDAQLAGLGVFTARRLRAAREKCSINIGIPCSYGKPAKLQDNGKSRALGQPMKEW